jgi:hypothetical protein
VEARYIKELSKELPRAARERGSSIQILSYSRSAMEALWSSFKTTDLSSILPISTIELFI